jgi:hypothetical protein
MLWCLMVVFENARLKLGEDRGSAPPLAQPRFGDDGRSRAEYFETVSYNNNLTLIYPVYIVE